MFSQGVCKGVRINLGPMVIMVDALVLDLGGLDVVLGVSWLSTLGKVVMDWKALSMQFWHKDELVVLQGRGGKQEQQGFLNNFLEDRHKRRGEVWSWSKGEKELDDAYLRGQLPEFGLKDKAGFKERGVDRDMGDEVGLNYGPKPKVWRVYTKRIKGIIIRVCIVIIGVCYHN